jgi:signal transduction histidine kinase
MKFIDSVIDKTLPVGLDDANLEKKVLNWLWLMLSTVQMCFYVLFFCIYSSVFYIDLIAPVSIGFAIVVLGIGIAWFTANGPNGLSMNFGLGSIFLAVVFPAFHSGGILFPSLIWLIPCLLLSALMQHMKTFLVWLGLYCLSFVLLYLLASPPSAALVARAAEETFFHHTAAMAVIGFQMYFVAFAYSTIVQEKERFQSELESLLQENKNLVRILCHDIANPLLVLDLSIGRVHIADPTMFKSLNRAKAATRALKELLEEVKRWQAVSDGKQTVSLVEVSIDEIVKKSIDVFSEKLLEKHITLNYKSGACSGYVDPFVLSTQVMNNLISNAIKFSPGGAQIDVWTELVGSEILIHVSDKGIGMDADLLSRIFSVTSKTSRPGTFGESGTGFGMPIMKFSVEKMGGTVEVLSRNIEKFPDSHGTTFTVRFPAKKPKADTASRRSEAA